MNIARVAVLGLVLASMGLTGAVMADVWDVAGISDDVITTQNQVSHGGVQVHDLGVRPGPVADEDWYRSTTLAYSSYEVTVEGMTGDLVPGTMSVERVDSTGMPLTSSLPLPGGFAKSLRWENATGTVTSEFVRVRGAACGTNCTSEDQYTIRFYDTAYSIPRFNNAGSQVTVLILQNTSPQEFVTGHAYFWSSNGTLLATVPFALNGHQMMVSNTAGVPGLQGVGGSITITSDGRYGQLTGKAVALEPSTGFSFDTLMLPQPL